MFENIGQFFRRIVKTEQKELGSKDAAKERLHLVLMQDRANVSADFLELMKQEIIDVIKKYIVVDESSIDVRLTNQSNDDGTNGAPALYANIPIVNIKNDMMAEKVKEFEGVDFNKEMGISHSTKTVEEKKEENKNDPPSVIALEPISEETLVKEKKPEEVDNAIKVQDTVHVEEPLNTVDSIQYGKEQEKQKEEVDKINQVEAEDANTNKNFMEEENEYEEDDDDITFDDLLKAAEAADKLEKNNSEEETNRTQTNNNKENLVDNSKKQEDNTNHQSYQKESVGNDSNKNHPKKKKHKGNKRK